MQVQVQMQTKFVHASNLIKLHLNFVEFVAVFRCVGRSFFGPLHVPMGRFRLPLVDGRGRTRGHAANSSAVPPSFSKRPSQPMQDPFGLLPAFGDLVGC